jgi:hypothetical protein
LNSLSPITDALKPQAYAHPAIAAEYDKAVRQYRRRLRMSAFFGWVSQADIEAQLQVHGMMMAAIAKRRSPEGDALPSGCRSNRGLRLLPTVPVGHL